MRPPPPDRPAPRLQRPVAVPAVQQRPVAVPVAQQRPSPPPSIARAAPAASALAQQQQPSPSSSQASLVYTSAQNRMLGRGQPLGRGGPPPRSASPSPQGRPGPPLPSPGGRGLKSTAAYSPSSPGIQRQPPPAFRPPPPVGGAAATPQRPAGPAPPATPAAARAPLQTAAQLLQAPEREAGRPLVGVAVGGAGLRSASFASGVLCFLSSSGALERVDVLACAGSAAYAVTAWYDWLARRGADPSRWVAEFMEQFERNAPLWLSARSLRTFLADAAAALLLLLGFLFLVGVTILPYAGPLTSTLWYFYGGVLAGGEAEAVWRVGGCMLAGLVGVFAVRGRVQAGRSRAARLAYGALTVAAFLLAMALGLFVYLAGHLFLSEAMLDTYVVAGAAGALLLPPLLPGLFSGVRTDLAAFLALVVAYGKLAELFLFERPAASALSHADWVKLRVAAAALVVANPLLDAVKQRCASASLWRAASGAGEGPAPVDASQWCPVALSAAGIERLDVAPPGEGVMGGALGVASASAGRMGEHRPALALFGTSLGRWVATVKVREGQWVALFLNGAAFLPCLVAAALDPSPLYLFPLTIGTVAFFLLAVRFAPRAFRVHVSGLPIVQLCRQVFDLPVGVRSDSERLPSYIYLSDAAYSEGTALLPLLRRGCDRIVLFDSTEDPATECAALTLALDRARKVLNCSFYPRHPDLWRMRDELAVTFFRDFVAGAGGEGAGVPPVPPRTCVFFVRYADRRVGEITYLKLRPSPAWNMAPPPTPDAPPPGVPEGLDMEKGGLPEAAGKGRKKGRSWRWFGWFRASRSSKERRAARESWEGHAQQAHSAAGLGPPSSLHGCLCDCGPSALGRTAWFARLSRALFGSFPQHASAHVFFYPRLHRAYHLAGYEAGALTASAFDF
eukprot:tig00001525_g9249.t1